MTEIRRGQGPFCIWHGLDLPNWLNLLWHRPALAWSQRNRLAGITAMSFSNSALGCLEGLLYRQFVAPNLYQTVFPGHCLLSQPVLGPLTKRFLPEKRTMDDIPITGWDVPQEDEIAICLLSLLSPYLMLAFPNHRDVYAPFL